MSASITIAAPLLAFSLVVRALILSFEFHVHGFRLERSITLKHAT